MRLLCIVVLLLLANTGKTQEEVLSHIPATGTTPEAFIPKGYGSIEVIKGDLNKDAQNDFAMVLFKKQDGDGDHEDEYRILVIGFKDETGYRLAFKGDNIILCKACGGRSGDPYSSISIKKGVLKIVQFSGNSWKVEMMRTFRYQDNDFYMIGLRDYSFWSVKQCDMLDGEFAGTKYEDINFVTGSREIKEISEECVLLVDKKDKIEVKPLVKMADIKLLY